MALCTNPPIPFVGDVERARSGDIRRWVGDSGIGSFTGSLCEGSNFGASDKVTGDPSPVAGDTDETLEYRLLKLLSPTVEAVLGGEGDLASRSSTLSGSAVESRLNPGSRRAVIGSVGLSGRSSGFRNAGEPSPRSGV
jgi:hypothetical protein